MKTETKALLESFCKEIKSLLLCSNTEKEKLLSGLRMDMEDYLYDHPAATMDDLQAHFGTPEDIANTYLFSLGETEVRTRIKKKKHLWYLLALGIAIIVIVGLILVAVFIKKATQELPAYYVTVESSAVKMESIPQETLNDPNAVTV